MQCILKLIMLSATSDDASFYTILNVCEPNQCINDVYFLFCVVADDAVGS